MNDKTLPYEAVYTACQEIGTLADAIESGCMNGITCEDPNFNQDQNLWLMRNAARTIGIIADHCIGGDMKGTEGWLGLPDMEQTQVQL